MSIEILPNGDVRTVFKYSQMKVPITTGETIEHWLNFILLLIPLCFVGYSSTLDWFYDNLRYYSRANYPAFVVRYFYYDWKVISEKETTAESLIHEMTFKSRIRN